MVNEETFNDKFLKVRRRMRELINGPCSSLGFRSIWHILEMEGLRVPRVNSFRSRRLPYRIDY